MRVWVDGKIDHASIKERVRVGSKDDIELHVLESRVDILETNCDQCRSMVQC